MSRRLLFLSLISLMLFVLAIEGKGLPRLVPQNPNSHVVALPPAADILTHQLRSPASAARTLDIEPVLPGGE